MAKSGERCTYQNLTALEWRVLHLFYGQWLMWFVEDGCFHGWFSPELTVLGMLGRRRDASPLAADAVPALTSQNKSGEEDRDCPSEAAAHIEHDAVRPDALPSLRAVGHAAVEPERPTAAVQRSSQAKKFG